MYQRKIRRYKEEKGKGQKRESGLKQDQSHPGLTNVPCACFWFRFYFCGVCQTIQNRFSYFGVVWGFPASEKGLIGPSLRRTKSKNWSRPGYVVYVCNPILWVESEWIGVRAQIARAKLDLAY